MTPLAKSGNIVARVTERPVVWMGSSLEDLRRFPAEVQKMVGTALHWAQSKRGIATTKRDVDLIKSRLRDAKAHEESRS